MTATENSKKFKMPKFKLIPDFKLKMKIIMGFFSVIAILVAVSGFGIYNFIKVSNDVEIYSAYVEEAEVVAAIETQFLTLQILANEYTATGEEELAKKAKVAMVELNKQIANGENHVTNAEDLATIKEIAHLAEVYEKDFEIAAHYVAEAKSLVEEKLNPSGESFIADLDKILKLFTEEGNAEAVKHVNKTLRYTLAAQRDSALALGIKDGNAFDKAEHEFALIKAELDAIGKASHTPEEIKLHAEMVELLKIYKTNFEKAAKDKQQVDELLHGEMAEQAELLLADTSALKQKVAKEEAHIREETFSIIQTAELGMLAVGLIGVLVGLGTSLLLGMQISNPVIGMTSAMTGLAEGDLETDIPAKDRTDEIGEMSRAVQVFKDNAIRARELEAQAEEQKHAEAEQKRKLMNEMADDFDNRVGGIVETVSAASAELNSTAQSMASIAEETSIQANSVSEASQRASGNVQTVASATEEMANSIAEINQQIIQASEVSKKAVEDVSSTATQMGLLAETADKIGNVISMISDIAEQTNLLALNATIESARAGEAGKGFAVVATEVKALANETAKATENISGLISEIQGQTKGAVDAISSIGSVISKLDETSSAIAAAMTEQGATTQEVARNVEEASVGTQEVSVNISGVTQASQESGAAAGEVTSAASELSRQAEVMKTEVTKFLGEIRAA